MCLVNLCVCYEIELIFKESVVKKNIVVIGVGFVGLSFVIYVVDCGY